MIELIQFPWSPFCIVQRRILEYAGARFRVKNIPNSDRSLVWRLTRGRYYGVPIIKDGKNVIFETSEDSQVIAKYLDSRLNLDLFPRRWRGVQMILWRHLENEIEGLTFKLNDIYWEEMVPPKESLGFVRHKERKFGRHCLEQWRSEQKNLVAALTERLVPYELMLVDQPFLLESRPLFVDFDLFGMLANFLYSGHYELPAAHGQLRNWYERMSKVKREK